jgi:hypothetical protein
MTRAIDGYGAVTEQLEPDRAHSCRNAIAMAEVMLVAVLRPGGS